ncbi:MAG: hypothetical protein WC119_01185 [Synergistaceae bacterium]
MGEVIVRLTVNKHNGNYETKILGHENGSTCGDGIDEDILNDLLNAEVPGFENMATAEDSGRTCEYFDEKQAKQQPHHYKYNEDDDGEDGDEEEKSKKNDLSLGYGV